MLAILHTKYRRGTRGGGKTGHESYVQVTKNLGSSGLRLAALSVGQSYTMASPGENEAEPLIPRSHGFKSSAAPLGTGAAQSTAMSNDEQLNSAPNGSMSKQINRKMDIALLPFLSLLYLLNGLDRSNVGNAETQGTLVTHMDDLNCSS